jgi:hypothetical protein
MKLCNLMHDFKYLSIQLETYRQLVLICGDEPLCQAWNVHANHVCLAHTVNVRSMQLLEQSWKQVVLFQ